MIQNQMIKCLKHQFQTHSDTNRPVKSQEKASTLKRLGVNYSIFIVFMEKSKKNQGKCKKKGSSLDELEPHRNPRYAQRTS